MNFTLQMCETQTCWKAGDLMHMGECGLLHLKTVITTIICLIRYQKKRKITGHHRRELTKCFVGVECLEVTFQQSAFWGPCFLLRSCVMTLLWLDPGVWGADNRAEGQRGSRTKNPVNDHLTKLGSRTYSTLITV